MLLSACAGDDVGPLEPTCRNAQVPTGAFTIDVGGSAPWPEGSVVALVTGGQGFPMLPVRAFLAGADIPSCVQVVVAVRVEEEDAGRIMYDLPFRNNGAGQHVSETAYVIVLAAYSGAEITVEVTVGANSVTRRVYAGS